MKYSVRGEIPNLSDAADANLLVIINNYFLYQLVTKVVSGTRTFEAWVNYLPDKNGLFNDLKFFVDQCGGWIDWHECSHDEAVSQPCVISETYTGV
jgi:hypothetical protein